MDQRYLELVLFKAERCWAYAMQLRDPPGGVPVCLYMLYTSTEYLYVYI